MSLEAYWRMDREQRQEWLEKYHVSLELRSRNSWIPEDPAQKLLQILAFLPYADDQLLRQILLRAQAGLVNFWSQVDLENAHDAKKEFMSWFTPEAKEFYPHDTRHFDAAVTYLQAHFMLLFKGGTPNLCRGIYTWARNLVTDPMLAQKCAVFLLIVSIDTSNTPKSLDHSLMLQLVPLVDKVLCWYPDACTPYMSLFASFYEACAQWNEAINLKERLFNRCRLTLGQNHLNTVRSRADLIVLLCKVERWKDAKEHQSTLLKHHESSRGEVYIEAMSIMYELALKLLNLGRRQDAEILQRHVCEGRRQVLGELHPDTLSAMHILAANYSQQGRSQEATDINEKVLHAWTRLLGKQHIGTLSDVDHFAKKHSEAGLSTKDAEESNLRAIEQRKGMLGSEHPDTLSSMMELALVYRGQGRWRTAVELAVNVLETQRTILGCNHTATISTMRHLASWYSEHGRLPDAAALYAEIVESMQEVYGGGHPQTLKSRDDLVGTYWKQGLWVQAEGLHRELLDARKRSIGVEGAAYITTAMDLATRYLNQCRWREASLLYKEVLEAKTRDPKIGEDNLELISIVCMRSI